MKLAEKFKEKPDICNAIGAHHDEVEQTSLRPPSCRYATPSRAHAPAHAARLSRHTSSGSTISSNPALSYPGVLKTYAIQAGRELRVIVGADKITDEETEKLSAGNRQEKSRMSSHIPDR